MSITLLTEPAMGASESVKSFLVLHHPNVVKERVKRAENYRPTCGAGIQGQNPYSAIQTWWGKMQRLSILFAVFGTLTFSSAASAGDLFSTSGGSAVMSSQFSYLDGRASQQYANSYNLTPNAIQVPGAPGSVTYDGKYRGEYLALARAAARKHGIPEGIFLKLVQQESAWNARAKSHAGAMGLAQLMPATARSLGVTDPWNPSQNLDGGARYLRMMYDRFHNWRLALAAYNAGPEAVAKYEGIPPYKETQGYVKAILGS
jgi:soluble lytic murein transglycosylase-like protein